MTLPCRLRADVNIDAAIVGKADLRALGGIAAGRLQIVRKSDAASLAAFRRLGAPRGETRRNPSVSARQSSTMRKSPLS